MATASLESFLGEIKKKTNGAMQSNTMVDHSKLAATVSNAVESFLASSHAAKKAGANGEITRANEALSFESLSNQIGVDKLEGLMAECQIPAQYRQACMQACAIALNRSMKGAQEAWYEQTKKADHTNNATQAIPLSKIYPESVVNNLSNAVPGQEAFGANIDMVVPDMKITLTTAIMNFHARIMPRFLPTRTVDQPNATYTKEYLEIYDNSVQDGKSMRLVDLYANPKFARNELQRIVPLVANDTEGNLVVKDGILQFGPTSNILKLSLRNDLPGYDKIRRSDLIAENVLLEFVYVTLTDGTTTEIFQIPVPAANNRLFRSMNGDSANRIGDFKFRAQLFNDSVYAATSVEGTWTSAPTQLLANLATGEFIELTIIAKPSVNIKRGTANCVGDVKVAAGHKVDPALISEDTKTLAGKLAAATGHGLVGYTLDARFSEENLRKTNISMMTHRVPMTYDIPIGRNYTFDYAIGQVNAEENAANLSKVIGIGQDDVQLDLIIKTLEQTYDRINGWTPNPEDPNDYLGADFVAGDKVRPTVFLGNLDFTKINVIRDSDRFGDVKQKALSYLNGVMARMMQLSFLQQQLGGSTTATFRIVTSMEVLSNVFAPEHIHNHMCKADQRDLGDGVEYVVVLPNGVRLEFITSTFDYMRDKLIMVPVIPGNAESELNFGQVWNNGNMVAHYTPSGDTAHHRLFANIREICIITNPVGCIINISGLDLVSGLLESETVRPTIVTVEATPYNG